MKKIKVTAATAIVISVVNLVLIGCIWLPDVISENKAKVGEMEIGPKTFSKETQKVLELTQEQWGQTYEIRSEGSKKIKAVNICTEKLENGKWNEEQMAGIGGNLEEKTVMYVSFSPEKGGFVNGIGTFKIPDCSKYIKNKDLNVMMQMHEKESIKPGKKNVLAMYAYSKSEGCTMAETATKTYYSPSMLKDYDGAVAVTIEFATKEP